jgi:hypothetical protein
LSSHGYLNQAGGPAFRSQTATVGRHQILREEKTFGLLKIKKTSYPNSASLFEIECATNADERQRVAEGILCLRLD